MNKLSFCIKEYIQIDPEAFVEIMYEHNIRIALLPMLLHESNGHQLGSCGWVLSDEEFNRAKACVRNTNWH